MGAVIFTLAAMLVIGGLAALVNAINLIPTDLGLAWLQIGFTLLSSGIIVLVIGLAAKMLGQQKSAPAQPRTEPSLPDWSTLPPGEEAKHPVIAAPEAAKSNDLAKAGIIAGAGVAAGALVGAAISGGKSSAEAAKDDVIQGHALQDHTAKNLPDDFESDLFADLLETPRHDDPTKISDKEGAHAAPDDADPEAARLEADEASHDTDLIDTTFPRDEASLPAEAKADADAQERKAEDQGDDEAPAPDDNADSALEKTPENGAALINLDEFELPPLPPILQPILPDVSAPAAPEPLVMEPVPNIDAAPPAVPGLIADADLAALTSDEPVLAPLETLDIVGSYDSGGTRFTMYSDGTVTAVGPTMDRRFVSLDALRKFIDGGAV